MQTTFKDKVLSLYRRTIRKHPKLKTLMMVISIVLLFFDRIVKQIKARTRKYVAVVVSLLFAFISCSFSSVIWGDGTTEFADTTFYYAETEESVASLASDPVISYLSNSTDDDTEIEQYEVGDDLSQYDVVYGADILDDVNIDASENIIEKDTEEEEYIFDQKDWSLVLVNKNHPIADDYTFELGYIAGSMQCDERVIPYLYSMLDAALKDGINLTVCSPYRNDNRQEMLFERKVSKYMSQGYSYMDSYKLASQAVTIPGSSEHQIGLAFDMLTPGYSSLDEGFASTFAGQWLQEHSYEYGFIIRYPAGKEEITGIEYEPWHLRYVGINAAKIMNQEELTLEEFWEKYL